jgi:hypothetical protein
MDLEVGVAIQSPKDKFSENKGFSPVLHFSILLTIQILREHPKKWRS